MDEIFLRKYDQKKKRKEGREIKKWVFQAKRKIQAKDKVHEVGVCVPYSAIAST